jgi:hypothetical protein
VLRSKKKASGGKHITDVFLVEDSIVGIPCNQTAWTHVEGKFAAAQAVTEGTTMSETKSAAAAGVGGERKRIVGGLYKGFFQEEVDERTSSVSFNVSCLIESLYDWRTRKGEEAELDELLAEFTAAIKLAMTRDPEAEPYLVYYGLSEAAAGRAAKSGEGAGSLAQKMRDAFDQALTEAGVVGEKIQGEVGAGEAAKSASAALLAEAQSKAVELEARVTTLTEEIVGLEKGLSTALDTIEVLEEQLGVEKATSLAAVTALEDYGREPLPRAGVSVS